MRSRRILEEIRAMRIEQSQQLQMLQEQREEDRSRYEKDRQGDRSRYEDDRSRSDELMRETRDVIRFNKEAFRRSELAFGDVRAEIQGMSDTLTEAVHELREDGRAHRLALLALIDRLEGGGPAPAG